MEIKKAIEELRKEEKRKFEQSVELIVNLKKFDVKKTPINTFVTIPHRIKDKRICGFIEIKSELIDFIPKKDFPIYKENKKKIKDLAKNYDFFISSAANMPMVATIFGRVLGPAGKMPSPKLGIIINEDEKSVKEIVEKINKVVRIQTKEPSIKLSIAKEKMKDSEIADNIKKIYNSILNELPRKKDNIKSVMIKTTMGKPIKVDM
jgi:large subunit ribosomal protein L1